MRFNFISVWGGFWSKMGSNLFYPQETGRISDRLYAIRDRDINLFLYTDGQSTLCIDAGYINNAYLKSDFEQVGIDPASITHLFLTHTDMDHAGGVDKDSKTNWFQQAKVFMGRDEKCMIDRSTARRFIFSNPVEISRACSLLDDGEVIHVGTVTVQAIATPGHTPGHMAYLIDDEILCSGDALVLKDGNIEPFYRTWNMDHESAKRSVRKLAVLENISVLCTAHTKCSHNFESAMNAWRG
ncbi:MAG: MBL fold metallo-hydrolase [Anaerolineales bacterium]|nr:MBL fold metallo-hydrolase [Anaerolineales bacterium]